MSHGYLVLRLIMPLYVCIFMNVCMYVILLLHVQTTELIAMINELLNFKKFWGLSVLIGFLQSYENYENLDLDR